MALPKKIPDLEELIERAAEATLQQNPHLFNPSEPRSDEEEAALQAEWKTYQQNIAPYVEEERGRGGGRPISEIICEDRGEWHVPSYCFDSSSLIKRYYPEEGSPWVVSVDGICM